ncbi:MAG TPA: Ldh family oxidoreductase, partial [Chloroflexota bacterium]|nr:Ldh family oxidoreductase [Chloroflexota bacterium]
MADYYTCKAGALQSFVEKIVRAMGADDDIALVVARHLVRSNLSGHDSHGVIRIPWYVAETDAGSLAPSARPIVHRDRGVTALIDAQDGFGHFSTAFALEWAVERAIQHGIAAAAIRHSTHIGRVGEYTERAAARGLISIVTVGAGGPGVGGMVLYGGREKFFGANPWSIGVPAGERAPMIFDGSTSAVAEGKVRVARAKGIDLPLGCIIDRDGKPTTDPNDFYDGGALLPLGGDVAGHKGYGLAMASALLSGLAMIDDPNPTLIGAPMIESEGGPKGIMAGVFLTVIDPAAFGDADQYQQLVG